MTADISSMYNQVKVPLIDIVQYRMTSYLFGGIWCTSCATYALQDCVKCTEDVTIQNIILNSFYVDDCLVSVKTEEEMINIISNLKDVLSCRGFSLTKYTMNDEKLMSQIPDPDLSIDITSMFAPGNIPKVLGIGWLVKGDCFYFDLNVNVNKSLHTQSRNAEYCCIGF